MFKYEMGSKVRDIVSGLEGIITARVQYLTGCNQYAINPGKLDKDGKPADAYYTDEQRIELIDAPKGKFKSIVPAFARGGPQRDTPRR